MTGRIKVVDSAGALVQATDSTGGDHTPDDYYTEPSAFDKACGTHGLGDYEDACPVSCDRRNKSSGCTPPPPPPGNLALICLLILLQTRFLPP